MKKLFTLLLALVATTALWAEDFSVGGIYYKILNGSEVAVTYRGSSYSSYSNEYSGSVTIPSTVTYNDTTYSVTRIRSVAFYDCSGLRSITIPNSVTSIGDRAFWYCYSLTKTNYTGDIAGWCNIKFGGSADNPIYYSHNFYINDQEIKDLVIPNTVDSIHDYAFAGCSSLTSVTIGNSVTSIGGCAFSECSGLTSVTIGNSVTSIGGCAFAWCKGLTSVTIGNSVTSIGADAFFRCSSLTSITIPNSVTGIGYGAFRECSRLASITIGESVTSIGGGVFRDCTGLTSVNVLAEVPPALGDDAFYNVSKKIPVYVPCSSVSAYQSAKGWKAFTNIQCMLEDESAVDNVHSQSTNSQKILRDGQLLILRDGVEYNAMGQEIQ